MAGTGCKYWTTAGESIEDEFDNGYTLLNGMLEQLPDTTAYKIRSGTAMTLFGIAQ